jgi:hypothetical protein
MSRLNSSINYVPDNCVGVVVQDVQQDDEVLENVEEDRPHRQSLNRFPTHQGKVNLLRGHFGATLASMRTRLQALL